MAWAATWFVPSQSTSLVRQSRDLRFQFRCKRMFVSVTLELKPSLVSTSSSHSATLRLMVGRFLSTTASPSKRASKFRWVRRVKLSYQQDHPLSKSARLDFVSRHRTLPWSDGVILAAQSIILGPNPNNHIFCPNWKSNLVLFRRSEKWFAKCTLEFCVDEQALANESEIQFDSRLHGDSFSLKLEPVFLNN